MVYPNLRQACIVEHHHLGIASDIGDPNSQSKQGAQLTPFRHGGKRE